MDLPSSTAVATPADPLHRELARLDGLLAHHLHRLRARGRTILGDAVGGAVIEEGEAEGLLRALEASHAGAADARVPPAGSRESPLRPLERARRIFGLADAERDLLLLTLAVEIDSRYARLVAFLNDHVALTRPTLGLGLTLVAGEAGPARDELLRRIVTDGPLLRFVLLRLEGDEPLMNRSLRVPPEVWPRLIGLPAPGPFPVRPPAAALEELELPAGVAEEGRRALNWAGSPGRKAPHVVVTGPRESGRQGLAEALAGGLRSRILVVHGAELETREAVRVLDREARWHHAVVVLLEEERVPVAARAALAGDLAAPLVSVAGGESGKSGKSGKSGASGESGAAGASGAKVEPGGRDRVDVEIPQWDAGDRSRLWGRILAAGGAAGAAEPDSLAARFPFGPGRMTAAVELARGRAEAHEREGVERDDLVVACRRLRETGFGDLARKLSCPFEPDDIVLPPATRRELELISAWARHGATTFGRDGVGGRLRTGRGLACLFSGPPGTGKTMAAQVIARQIDYDVFRIDLSQVVNKYVGETEKNLSRVFDEAERSRVILFFDEADALFGRRSEVKDAHDRFANIEVGYLLQRLEVHQGLVILATNLQKNLDDAFLRRLQVRADFPVPGPDDRKAIWERLLPRNRRAPDVDTGLLSSRFEIAGGDIRNAIFTALLWAAEEGAEVAMRHLVLGLWRELQKSGRVVDLAHFGPWREAIEDRGEGPRRRRRNGTGRRVPRP